MTGRWPLLEVAIDQCIYFSRYKRLAIVIGSCHRSKYIFFKGLAIYKLECVYLTLGGAGGCDARPVAISLTDPLRGASQHVAAVARVASLGTKCVERHDVIVTIKDGLQRLATACWKKPTPKLLLESVIRYNIDVCILLYLFGDWHSKG